MISIILAFIAGIGAGYLALSIFLSLALGMKLWSKEFWFGDNKK